MATKYAHLIKDAPVEHRKPGPPRKTKYGDRITDTLVMVETPGNCPWCGRQWAKITALRQAGFLFPSSNPS
jgi:hypothetical protein